MDALGVVPSSYTSWKYFKKLCKPLCYCMSLAKVI